MAATYLSYLLRLTVFAAIGQQAAGADAPSQAASRLRGSALLQVRGTTSKSTAKVVEGSGPGESSIAETLKELDANGDGKVDKTEIESFAKSQGLSKDEVSQDFQDLDSNGNGELEASEIGAVLSETASSVEPAVPVSTPMAAPVARQVEKQPSIQQASPVVTKSSEAPAASKMANPVVNTRVPAQPAPHEASLKEPSNLELHLEEVQQASHKDSSNRDLDLETLQQDAERHAGSVLAETVAREAQQMFQQGAKDEERAVALDQLAKSLRTNMTSIAHAASTDTKHAAQEATASVANAAYAEVRRLKTEAEKTEKEAAERRHNAQAAMQRVMKAQAALTASSKLLNDGLF